MKTLALSAVFALAAGGAVAAQGTGEMARQVAASIDQAGNAFDVGAASWTADLCAHLYDIKPEMAALNMLSTEFYDEWEEGLGDSVHAYYDGFYAMVDGYRDLRDHLKDPVVAKERACKIGVGMYPEVLEYRR